MSNFVTVEARDLRKAMKLALDIVQARNTIPILSHVRLLMDSNGLRVIATDLDIEAMTHVDVIDLADTLDICIDARRLYEIASAAGVMPMKIEKIGFGAQITLDNGAAIYTINTLPSEDFPMFDWKRTAKIETFSNGSLAALLSKVRPCISTEETRYYLNGIAWQFAADGRRFVATDGHRLAACLYNKEGTDKPISRIIPRKTVGIITRHLANKDVEIFATERETAIDIVLPGLVLRTKLIDGTFPDWSRVVPTNPSYKFRITRQEITTAIAQATAIGGERIKAVKFTGSDGFLVIEHKCIDFGKSSIKTSATWPVGLDHVGFNHHYFRSMTAGCSNEIEISLEDSGAPTIIRDLADDAMTRVLMPMRV